LIPEEIDRLVEGLHKVKKTLGNGASPTRGPQWERSSRMTYIIAQPCIDIKDRSCVDVCPVDCIHEFERILIIDPEECIDCGPTSGPAGAVSTSPVWRSTPSG
jgi:Fe-S-cluster-containing hydrogenase component 2